MQTTHSSQQLDPVVYIPRGGRPAVLYLRENITRHDDGEGGEYWTADEVRTTTDLPQSEIAENFDSLWVKAVNEGRSLDERLAVVEEILDATVAVVLGDE